MEKELEFDQKCCVGENESALDPTTDRPDFIEQRLLEAKAVNRDGRLVLSATYPLSIKGCFVSSFSFAHHSHKGQTKTFVLFCFYLNYLPSNCTRKILILSMPSTRAPPLSPSRSVSPTPTHRRNLLNWPQDRYLSIKGRLYPASGPRPKVVVIKTHCASGSRFPSAELVFSGIDIEPGVHDTIVTVKSNSQEIKFLVLCKSSTNLPVNQTIANSEPASRWHGDLLIMRIGSRAKGVVNWRGCENYIATHIVNE